MGWMQRISLGMIGLPLMAFLVMSAGWAPFALEWIYANKAIFWSVGAGLFMFGTVKDARLLLAAVLVIYIVSTYLLGG